MKKKSYSKAATSELYYKLIVILSFPIFIFGFRCIFNDTMVSNPIVFYVSIFLYIIVELIITNIIIKQKYYRELCKISIKYLKQIYGEDISIKTTNKYINLDSKGIKRKRINYEVYIPKYNCNLIHCDYLKYGDLCSYSVQSNGPTYLCDYSYLEYEYNLNLTNEIDVTTSNMVNCLNRFPNMDDMFINQDKTKVIITLKLDKHYYENDIKNYIKNVEEFYNNIISQLEINKSTPEQENSIAK